MYMHTVPVHVQVCILCMYMMPVREHPLKGLCVTLCPRYFTLHNFGELTLHNFGELTTKQTSQTAGELTIQT